MCRVGVNENIAGDLDKNEGWICFYSRAEHTHTSSVEVSSEKRDPKTSKRINTLKIYWSNVFRVKMKVERDERGERNSIWIYCARVFTAVMGGFGQHISPAPSSQQLTLSHFKPFATMKMRKTPMGNCVLIYWFDGRSLSEIKRLEKLKEIQHQVQDSREYRYVCSTLVPEEHWTREISHAETALLCVCDRKETHSFSILTTTHLPSSKH